jgi:hypothetical protein
MAKAAQLFGDTLFEKGVKYGLIAGSFTYCCFQLGINGPLLDRYKNQVRFYVDGLPAPLEKDTEELAYMVLQDMHIAKRKKPDIQFFKVVGDEPFHAGCLEMAFGSIVGLPHNFSYKSVDTVPKDEINALRQPVKWDTKPGRKLLESLVLSEKAKKFAIAREMYYTDSHHISFMVVASIAAITTGCVIGEIIIKAKKYQMMEKPPFVRVILYGFCFFFGAFNYIFVKDGLQTYYDVKSDKRAAMMGDEYFDGGIEYYSQMLKRNKALRKLMGQQGQAYFNSEGDLRTLWRTPTLPLKNRIDRINDLKNPDHDEYS